MGASIGLSLNLYQLYLTVLYLYIRAWVGSYPLVVAICGGPKLRIVGRLPIPRLSIEDDHTIVALRLFLGTSIRLLLYITNVRHTYGPSRLLLCRLQERL